MSESQAYGTSESGRVASEPHAFDKDWLDCCKVCGEGIENQTPGMHVVGRTPDHDGPCAAPASDDPRTP